MQDDLHRCASSVLSGRGPIDFPIPCGKISLLPFTCSFQYFWSINMSLWITMSTWFLHWLISKIKSLTCIRVCMLSRFSHVRLFETPWTTTYQALSVGFSRPEYWSGLPRPPPGDLPHPEMEPASPTLQADCLPLNHWGKNGEMDAQILLQSAKHSAS